MAVGLPLKTTYANGDVYSASDVNDTNGTINAFVNPITAGKNALINGGMDIWQRGTSSSSTGYQTVDRWYGNWTGTATYSQESTTVPSGSRFALKMAATATAQLYANQAIETMNAARLAGQNVTFSIYAQGSTSIPMSLVVYYSTNVDQPLTSAWTTITPTSGGTGTAVSGSFTRISGVWAIPSTAKSVMVQFNTTSTIASGAFVIVGQTQLEEGSTATTFSRAGGTIQGELAACQRYYHKFDATGQATAFLIGSGFAFSTTIAMFVWHLGTTMRTGPSSMDIIGQGIYNVLNSTSYSGGTWSLNQSFDNSVRVIYTHGSAVFTLGQALASSSTTAGTNYIAFSAEL